MRSFANIATGGCITAQKGYLRAVQRPGSGKRDSYDPTLCEPAEALGIMDPWDHVRTEYARGAPTFLAAALPGLDPDRIRFVPIMSPTPHPLGWPRRTCAAPAWFSTPWRMRVAPERPVRRPRSWASTSRTVRP
jgi:hypothetical protein